MMGQAKRPMCVLCGFEAHGLPDRKQDLVQRYVGFSQIWLHLQCEFLYRQLGGPHPEFHSREKQ
jgi:hypothetical protein